MVSRGEGGDWAIGGGEMRHGAEGGGGPCGWTRGEGR